MSKNYRDETSRLHNAAARNAVKKWRLAHSEEWDQLWAVLRGMLRKRHPEANAGQLWTLTMSAMRACIIEEHPEEWDLLRREALAEARAETGWQDVRWTPQRRQEQSALMSSQPRLGGRVVKAAQSAT